MATAFKVFGIGFHKTATTSLANALYTLGYNVTGYFGVNDPDISRNAYKRAFNLAERFDAVQDTPWPVLYKDLDIRFPGSKFILTVRPSNRWIRSVVKHFKNHYIPAHEWIYGVESALGNEEIYIRRYETHNREVLKYFKGRPQDLLVMDITKGDGWGILCPFLGEEIPPFAFPAQNTANQKSRQFIKRCIRYLERRFPVTQSITRRNQMDIGVSSAFLRDILHYHYGIFDDIWDGVNQLTEAQFVQVNPDLKVSIRDLLSQQMEEENTWYKRLAGEAEQAASPGTPSSDLTRDQAYQLWKHNRLLMRRYAANLTDEVRRARVPGRKEYIWEVIVHLMNNGTEQGGKIRKILEDLGQGIEKRTFISFYHDDP